MAVADAAGVVEDEEAAEVAAQGAAQASVSEMASAPTATAADAYLFAQPDISRRRSIGIRSIFAQSPHTAKDYKRLLVKTVGVRPPINS